jgi:uncharacterized damage-inducible protein DinB
MGFMKAPQYPAGPFETEKNYDGQRRKQFIDVIQAAPARLREAVAGLAEDQLNTRYKNWTIRQIVHHIADSHVNSYVRFKWTLTEELPTIKAYDEGRWAELEDSQVGDVGAPLALLEGLHARWVQLLRPMTEEQFRRSFIHPETRQTVSLNDALCYYAWHCKHHTGQVSWLRQQNGW